MAKRILLTLVLVLFFFVLGWISAVMRLRKSEARSIAFIDEQQASSIASIRQEIYGGPYSHAEWMLPEDKAKLEAFRAAGSKGSITLSHVGGMGVVDSHVRVEGNGSVSLIQEGTSRQVATLDPAQCEKFFRGVITSGLANYSEAVIEIKRALVSPERSGSITDAPMTGFRLNIPELGIDHSFEIYTPRKELENYPDIVEYQRIVALEQEMLGFIPKEDAFWKGPVPVTPQGGK